MYNLSLADARKCFCEAKPEFPDLWCPANRTLLSCQCDESGNHISKCRFQMHDADAIPSAIGLLTYLTSLTVDWYSNTNPQPPPLPPFPKELAQLQSLAFLSLKATPPSPLRRWSDAPFPPELFGLTLLTRLDLSGIALHPDIGRLCYLKVFLLYLSECRFELSDLFKHLTRLENLQLYEVTLRNETPFPSEIGLLRALTRFFFSDIPFVGTLPTELGLLTDLEDINIGMCQYLVVYHLS